MEKNHYCDRTKIICNTDALDNVNIKKNKLLVLELPVQDASSETKSEIAECASEWFKIGQAWMGTDLWHSSPHVNDFVELQKPFLFARWSLLH